MAARSECFDELYEEALMIDKECNGSVTFSDIQKMKKLYSFVKESLRHTGEIGKIYLITLNILKRYVNFTYFKHNIFQSVFLIMLHQKVTPFLMVIRFQKVKIIL